MELSTGRTKAMEVLNTGTTFPATTSADKTEKKKMLGDSWLVYCI